MLIGTFQGADHSARPRAAKFREAKLRGRPKSAILSSPMCTARPASASRRGTHGVIQMPRCTIAVRRYIDSGGLYMVLYDTNSLCRACGQLRWLFAIPVCRQVFKYIVFCGPWRHKRKTTGMDIPPEYHQRSYRALSRGHIQGIWDRRQIRNNLQQALVTIGGRNLYYR